MRKTLIGIAGVATGALLLSKALRKPSEDSSQKTKARSRPAGKGKAAKQSTTVWVNTDRGVYHFPNTRWYGKTAIGEFMEEAAALAAGHRPAKASSSSD